MTDKDIEEIIIYKDADNNIFNTSKCFQIPLYQRAFAWEDKQIIQLLEDINDSCIETDSKYYIGSLIVADRGSFYEVVDGQQRLTTLFLLLHCLDVDLKTSLNFACRDKSNYTLENLSGIMANSSVIDQDKIQESIISGVRIIQEELTNTSKYGNGFKEKLSHVIMYKIVVPPHTDLNHYFETMNTRGEQLEQHDILKATLMSYLQGDKAWMAAFAEIWNACRDMSGYVQMNFSKASRELLFGTYWNCITSSWKPFVDAVKDKYSEKNNSIFEIIEPNFAIKKSYDILDSSDRDASVRFESIIEFPYFLLHCLKTFVNAKRLKSDDGKELYESLLNDKKLNSSFERVIEHGLLKEKPLERKTFAKEFIKHLLTMRFLFDKFIIKREFIGDSLEGQWSLKTLNVSGQGSNKKAYFTDTSFLEYYQKSTSYANRYRHSDNLMIQAALRVSYTSPKVMHWITGLLSWLAGKDNVYSLNKYCEVAEQIAQRSIIENFFNQCETGIYTLGVGTPHVVFNYLDYLIWKSDRNKYKDFTFEFRNSVEHWYPRHPSESEIKIWKDGVDRFGNLCIIQRNVNSKFSNLPPEGKKTSFKSMIEKGSLKLRLMSEMTTPSGDLSASQNWKNKVCEEHEKKMIQILSEACGITE
ncbi:MAG: DUF262 domain-containing protein [Bacteroidales bacterium]|nr:DUF262 domain-containing protein [Bacteroidales bacterium]